MKLKVDLNERGILNKVTNDRFGLFVSSEWVRLIDPYTPRDTGHMQDFAWLEPWTITYGMPYSAYVYYGEKYVDPVYGVSGFLGKEGWFSRPGVKKVPSGENLKYQKNNPYATDHWDEKAAKGGQLSKLYRTLNNGLQNGY